MARKRSAINELIESISLEQRQFLYGSLLVDYDKIAETVKQEREAGMPEKMILIEVVKMAYSCIQPVDVKKLSRVSGFKIAEIEELAGKMEEKLKEAREGNRKKLIKVLDVLDFTKLFSTRSSFEASKFVRKTVLGQEIDESKEVSQLNIENLTINVTGDFRKQVLNQSVEAKDVFALREKRRPKQLKPTDKVLDEIIDVTKKFVEEKVKENE